MNTQRDASKPSFDQSWNEAPLPFDPGSIPSWRSSTPMGPAIDAEHRRILKEAIGTMPVAMAATLNLRHGLGPLPALRPGEIAVMLDLELIEVERLLTDAHRMLRAELIARGMDGVEGGDEAIMQASPPSGMKVAISPACLPTVRRLFDEGVAKGTHSPVDTAERAARRAQAALASEKVDPEWARRDAAKREDAKRSVLQAQASRRAALAAATAVVTRAALDTPTLSLGLKPDDDHARFAIYVFDGRDREGWPLMGGAYQDAAQMDRRFEQLKLELAAYRDRRTRPLRPKVA
jgi:hypothetical protein